MALAKTSPGGHRTHVPSLFDKMKRGAEKEFAQTRGSMKLEESEERTARMNMMKEHMRNKLEGAVGRLFRKTKTDTMTTGVRRSLLQTSSGDFAFATSSEGCQNTLKALGVTNVAAQMDGYDTFDVSSTYAECEDFGEVALSAVSGPISPSSIPDICSKSCKDDIVHWVGAFSSTCGVDLANWFVNELYNELSRNGLTSQSDKMDAFDAAGPYLDMLSNADKIGISTLIGCDSSDTAGTCESKTWWYELAIDQVDVENDANDDGCDDTGTAGDFISSCSALGDEYCSGAYEPSSCCYTTGLITGVSLDIVAACPFVETYKLLYSKAGIPFPSCIQGEIDFKCSSSGLETYLDGMEAKATQCCSSISGTCSATGGSGKVSAQITSYNNNRNAISLSSSNTPITAMLFTLAALAVLNLVGLA